MIKRLLTPPSVSWISLCLIFQTSYQIKQGIGRIKRLANREVNGKKKSSIAKLTVDYNFIRKFFDQLFSSKLPVFGAATNRKKVKISPRMGVQKDIERGRNCKKESSYLPTKPLTITTRCSGKPPCCAADSASHRSSPPRTDSASIFFPLDTGSVKQEVIQRREPAFSPTVPGSRLVDRRRNPNLSPNPPLGRRIRGTPKSSLDDRSMPSAVSIRGRHAGFRRSRERERESLSFRWLAAVMQWRYFC